MVGHLSRLDAIKLAVARGVARSGVKRALDHLQLEMAYGDDVIEELLVNGKFEELVHKYEGLSDLAAASGSAVESIADDASKHCFHARVDVSERDDGVCDPHDFGALRGLGGGAQKTKSIAAGWASSYGTTSTGGPCARSTSTASRSRTGRTS